MKNRIKMAWLQGVEKVGTGASNMASSAQTKLREINMENERRKIVNEIPGVALSLWQAGVEFPTELSDILAKLDLINTQLSELEAERVARLTAAKEAKASMKAEQAAINETEEVVDETVEETAEEVETESVEDEADLSDETVDDAFFAVSDDNAPIPDVVFASETTDESDDVATEEQESDFVFESDQPIEKMPLQDEDFAQKSSDENN